MPRLLAVLAASLLLVASCPAHAIRSPDSPAGTWPPTAIHHAESQAALDASPAWRAFRASHGPWRALWNERTGTPHLATGPPIPLARGAVETASLDGALRAFIARNPALFGGASAPELETVRLHRAGRIWYAGYRRLVAGLPVLFEDWEFRVSAEGRLMAFAADAHAVPAGAAAAPGLDAAAAREAARSSLGLPPDASVEGGESLAWLPDESAGVLHLVREVRASVAQPAARWIVLVDAVDGAIRWRHDRVRRDVTGDVSGLVHLGLPTDPTEARPFAHQQVHVGPASAWTDAAGHYGAPASGTTVVSTDLSGSFCDVTRLDLPSAAFSTTVADPALVDVSWDDLDSHVAERDVFYHVNRMHDHVVALDPGFTANDYPMPCQVNYAASCDAFWDGQGITFFRAGGGCPNTGTMPDVVYHEYGHSVSDNLYVANGAPYGLFNGALHEGLADVAAAFVQDNPSIGQGFLGPGTVLRTLDNTRRWPEDRDTDPHLTGLILGGAMWDLRQSLGLATTERLFHFAKYSLPDDPDDGRAMGEYFVALLLADDDDGSLANGTPHSNEILSAFNAHGIGTGLFLAISHAPLEDQPAAGPYPVSAIITYSGPIGAVDPASVHLSYSVNDSPLGVAPLALAGPSQYEGQIPAPTRAIVRYRIEAAEQSGGVHRDPPFPDAPRVFLAGATTTYLVDDLETTGWIAGAPGDDATAGRWQWTAPMGSTLGNQTVQPDADHTPYGILCYVTENPWRDFSPGAHDVDGGRTTLTSGQFDATAAGPDPILEYYRWYTNELGSNPRQDHWRVDVTNDGGASWTPVEDTAEGRNAWRRVVFFLRDFVAPTPFMRLRFVAEDVGPPSLVEAAVDDLRLSSFDEPVTGIAPSGPASMLTRPSPNPFRDRVRLGFSLASPQTIELGVFDLAGRRVRALRSGVLEGGAHQAWWDGLDDRGQPVSSGLYFVRLDARDGTFTRRVVRAR